MSQMLLFMALAIVAIWWWTSRTRVSPAPVAMVAQRIQFPGGVRLHDAEGALTVLRNPEEIVIPHEHATLVIDYPLSTPAKISLSSKFPLGFTRAELIKAVCEEYENIYEAEEATATTKPIPLEERTTLKNRNRTDGVYGIYGHDLDDLVLTAARWSRGTDGTVTIELHVES